MCHATEHHKAHYLPRSRGKQSRNVTWPHGGMIVPSQCELCWPLPGDYIPTNNIEFQITKNMCWLQQKIGNF